MAHSTAKRRLRWFQFSVRTLLILMVLCAIGLTAWRAYVSPVEQLVQAVLRAEDPSRAEAAYRELFKTAGPAWLNYLKHHRHDSIAIQAAWEEVELTLPLKEPTSRVQLDRSKLKSFLGFLEERARVQAPKWWAETLLDAEANCRYNIYRYPKVRPYHWAGLGLHAPLDTTLKEEGGKVVLHVGNDSVVIPEGILDPGGRKRNVSALMAPERCYVAVHDDWGFDFKLTCIDRASATVLWQSDVWGTLWDVMVSGGGRPSMWVTLTEQDNRVVVFGVSGAFHVEAFRSDDGANLFRFSNSY